MQKYYDKAEQVKTRHRIYKVFIEQIGWGILCLKLSREQKRTILNWWGKPLGIRTGQLFLS